MHMVRRIFLFCGLGSSIFYVVMNVVAVRLYEGYNVRTQTVSELSAIDAPTRSLWVALSLVYSLLVIAFAVGIWLASLQRRPLRVAACLILTHGILGLFWPPMHQRDVLAAGGAALTDTLHLVFAIIVVPIMMATIAFGAAPFGKPFRFYSLLTLIVLTFFGLATGLEAPQLSKDLPTPWIGVWERINIGVYMWWIAVFSILLLGENKTRPHRTGQMHNFSKNRERAATTSPQS
jgi:hypothetical protein